MIPRILRKDGAQAISVFKRRLSSVMALIMNRNTLFFVAAIVLVALAACGKGNDEKAAARRRTEVLFRSLLHRRKALRTKRVRISSRPCVTMPV